MTSPERIEVTTVVAVDPATAFEVFTEEVDRWWKHGPRFRPGIERTGAMCFEPGVGGRLLEVYDDGDPFELGRVRVWKPPECLVFEMRGRDFGAGESTEVEVRFEPDGDGTRVTVEHRGWEAFAPGHPVRHGLTGEAFASMMGLWWGDLLVALRQHVAKKDAP